MTLRVTLTVVPYGDELNKYDVGYMDINNQGGYMGYCDYKATVFSDGLTILKHTEDKAIQHDRRDGHWVLLYKALEELRFE